MAKDKKVEFRNITQGYLGAVTINRKGDEVSVAIAPGDSVFLNEDEQQLTAQAHRKPEDNPFQVTEIVFYDPLTQDETGREHRAPLERVDVARPTGAAQVPDDTEPETGVAASDEEVGVPDAPARKRPSRQRAAAVS